MRNNRLALLRLFGDTDSAADTIAGDPAADAGQQAETAAPENENTPGSHALSAGFKAHIQELARQETVLRQTVPDFDLRRELQNPVFVRLTAPGSGLTVEDAYFAIHRERLQQAAVEAAERKISNAIRAGSGRPHENGAGASTVAAFDYRAATPQQRAELKRRIRLAAARGEKLYPG